MFQIGELLPGIPKISKISVGAQKFEKIMSSLNGDVCVGPLLSCQIHSTDDTTVYFVPEGIEKDQCEWRIGYENNENTDVHSNYKATKI